MFIKVFILLVILSLTMVFTNALTCDEAGVEDAAAATSVVDAAAGTITVAVSYDKTCSACFEEKGYCLDRGVTGDDDNIADDLTYYKKNYRQFYDCIKGGKSVTESSSYSGFTMEQTIQYCQFKPNSKYYAVIIVPVLVFSFALIGLAYYLIKVRKSSYSPPPENKSVEMTTGTV